MMENCYERILELLGTHKDDPLFAKFVEDLGETPNMFLDSRHRTEFMFEQSGFTLSFMKKPDCFTYAFLYGKRHKYTGNLPGGIAFGDPPQIVADKINLRPFSSKPTERGLCEEYDVPPYRICFSFGQDGGFCMLSLVYVPGNDIVNKV